jgi:aspartyl protease family protein
VAVVTINGTHEGRFLIDTGSSVTIVSPAAAAMLGLTLTPADDSIELQTLAGKTAGQRSVLRSLAIGSVELSDVPVVVHEPGPGLDGILGNTVLGRYQVTLDADRRVLHLRQFQDH